MRVGIGYDVHKLVENRKLVLGGVEIEHDKGLLGHSDAAVSYTHLKEEGGVLNNYGVVDFVNGIAPGVFVVVTHKLKEVRDEMEYLSMGPGPNYILYRPYHLCSLETPLSAAMAVIEGKGTIVPKGGLVADVITVAKKDVYKRQS